LESIGILPAAEEKASDYLHNYQKNCLTFENDKYTASLPWKPDHPKLLLHHIKKNSEHHTATTEDPPYYKSTTA
jgi:hypothetical protein